MGNYPRLGPNKLLMIKFSFDFKVPISSNSKRNLGQVQNLKRENFVVVLIVLGQEVLVAFCS